MDESLQQIVNDCIKGKRLAQEQLYRRFYPQLFVLCRRFFASDHGALECLNDGMLKVFRSIARFDSNRGSLFNWMYTIVRNAALDRLRRLKADFLPLDLTCDTAVPDLNPLEMLEGSEVYALLDELPPATRAICSLYYLEDFDIREISEKIGITPGTVKWHLSECRSRIRNSFRIKSQNRKAR